ncbi:MAG TPA: DUF1269 domain-containing protein [Ktedonobacterales bacterium]|nr:DUF1269 domain-containing protein [Ktedonobacterales bacterium]
MATEDPNEVLVVAFAGAGRAAQVLQNLQQLNHEHLIHLKNAAIITCDASGKINIHETHDFDSKQGAVAGALAGGLLGLLKGNLVEGALLGAGSGFVASKVVDLGFKDDYLREIATNLRPDSSAIVAMVLFEHADQAIAELNVHGGTILRQTLPPDVAQKLSAAVQG